MIKYIIKRILILIPIIFGIIFIIYAIIEFSPGDPVLTMMGEATQEVIDARRAELGLDIPFLQRYISYSIGVFRGDLGTSFQFGLPVMDILAVRFPITFILAILSMLVTVIIGMPIGILSAVKQYSAIDNISIVFAMAVTSLPVFWLGLLLQLLFSFHLNLFPAAGFTTLSHMVLPVLTLAIARIGSIIRLTRSSMLEVIRSDYIRTARAKGASEKIVIFGHALKNALLPVVTVTGYQFGWLLGGSVLVETVFAIPGIGTMVVQAIRTQDAPIVLGGVVLIAIAFCITNLITDLTYTFIDPRLRTNLLK